MNLDFDIVLLISILIFLFTIGINIYWTAKNSKIPAAKRIIISLILFAASIGLITITYLNSTPHIAQSTPNTEGILANYSDPVLVVFNMPVDSSRITENVTPNIKGHWEWIPYLGIPKLTRVGLFYPEETLFENHRIVIYITGIGRLGFINEGHEGGFVFDSAKLPEIMEISPQNKSKDISGNREILITYDKPLDNLVDIAYKFSPEVGFDISQINETQFKIKPKTSWQLSTHYTLTVDRTDKRLDLTTNEVLEHENPVVIHKYEFDTMKEPLIDHFAPEGNEVKTTSEIKMLFFSDMERESVEENFVINPNVPGEFKWVSDKALVYIPTNPLPRGVKFEVLLKSGIRSKNNLSTNKDIIYNFETIGKIAVKDHVPFDGEVKVNEKTQIKITFNQEVDKSSVEQRFTINPSVPGSFVWGENNTVTFVPANNLAFDTKYTVTLNPGISALDGIDSTDSFAFSFSTRRNEVVISMPLYYQPQYPVSFSCNIYASMMALAWKGYSTSASGLIGEIGYDPSQDSQGRWLANPNSVYVGNSDGSWGYGVYWYAIQKVFSNRGIKTEIHENWNLRSLAKAVEAGHPVQIWRYNGTSTDKNLQWGTPGVYAINGQHGGVVTGFRGSSDNPTAFYINDPWFGLIWMNAGSFDYYWSRLNRVGMVIF